MQMEPAPPMNEFEAQRAARIAENRQRLEALGIPEAAQQLVPKKPMRWKQPSNKSRAAPVVDPVATRASKRIRGQPVDTTTAQMDDGSPDQSSKADSSTPSCSTNKTKGQSNQPRFALTSTVYAAPFSLPSIGVTVWELGELYRGPFSSNYYSSRGCLYRHAYPVGYRASKEVFGFTWEMTITAGKGGPVFTVSQKGGGRSFSGPTPTRPWTDACLAFRPAQRISGPLFFGFSDVHVQRALAAMYTPAELAYTLYGRPLTEGPLTREELQQLQQQQQETVLQDNVGGAAKVDQQGPSNAEGSSGGAVEQADGAAFELTSTECAAPFSLTASGEWHTDSRCDCRGLGQIYRGAGDVKYWSSRGTFRHAYPVGYRASKEVFGFTWEMTITAGEGGPVFTVSQQGGSRSFSAPNPTRAWTDVCKAFKTGQRISGPLFFGFSDVHVQRALAAMYTPAELAYTLYGSGRVNTQAKAPWYQHRGEVQQQQQKQQQQEDGPNRDTASDATAPSPVTAATTTSDDNSADSSDTQQGLRGAGTEQQQQQLAAAEAFAAELQSVKGIGAATAQVLALTTALGGARHVSLNGLCSWLAAEPQHAQQLQHYLLTSDEVPRCSRQLPSWREKWVPLIMQQLLQPTQSS